MKLLTKKKRTEAKNNISVTGNIQLTLKRRETVKEVQELDEFVLQLFPDKYKGKYTF